MVLDFLLRHHARTDDPTATRMVESTCTAMARVGLYDQIGGGFDRYSVDAGWVVPHFEKMLYDNAQLLGLYARWGGNRSAEKPPTSFSLIFATHLFASPPPPTQTPRASRARYLP